VTDATIRKAGRRTGGSRSYSIPARDRAVAAEPSPSFDR
jgi:hypothetical protein